jgi:protoporphyrinogen oxidase
VPPWETLRLRRLHRLLDWFGERLDPHAPERATRLDDRSVADFARLYLGPRLCERLLEPLLEAQLGLRAETSSRVLLFLLLGRRGEPRLQLGFGLGALPARLALPLRDVRTEARVIEVRPDGRGVRLATGEQLDASAVVLALPSRAVQQLLPDPTPVEELLLGRPHYESRTTLAVVTEPMSTAAAAPPVIWVPPVERGLLAGVFRVPLEPERARGRALLLLTGRPGLDAVHPEGDERGAAESLLRDAGRVLPTLRQTLRAQRLHRAPDAVASFDVGHYRAIARLGDELAKRRDQRRVFLAGDWLCGPHLEGAASSGLRAADDVLEAIG